MKEEPIRYEWGMQLREAPKNIFTGDYNNDGMSDLLIIQENGYKIYFTSTGNFKDGRMFSEPTALRGVIHWDTLTGCSKGILTVMGLLIS